MSTELIRPDLQLIWTSLELHEQHDINWELGRGTHPWNWSGSWGFVSGQFTPTQTLDSVSDIIVPIDLEFGPRLVNNALTWLIWSGQYDTRMQPVLLDPEKHINYQYTELKTTTLDFQEFCLVVRRGMLQENVCSSSEQRVQESNWRKM